MTSWKPVSTLILRLVLVLIMAGQAPASLAAAAWDGNYGEEDGVPLVQNPFSPMTDDETIKPELAWRIGGGDGEDDVVFGLIGDAIVDEEGNTYLLDVILSTIYKVAPDGEIVEQLGREGDGPGEFRNSGSLTFMPGGDIGILEMMPGRIVVLGRDGLPRPSFFADEGGQQGMRHMQQVAATEQGVIIGQVTTRFDEGSVTVRYALDHYAPDGSLVGNLFQEEDVQTGGAVEITMGGAGDGFTTNWSLGQDGRLVVYQKGQEYKLEVFGAEGTPEKIIRRDYEPVRRPEYEIERARKQQESLRARFGDGMGGDVQEIARHISGVSVRADGELWVANSQGDHERPDGSVGYFDVFDTEGYYAKRILIEADYDSQRDNFRIRGNHLFVFKEAQNAPERTATSGGGGMMMVMAGGGTEEEDEDEEPRPYEVICYRLP